MRGGGGVLVITVEPLKERSDFIGMVTFMTSFMKKLHLAKSEDASHQQCMIESCVQCFLNYFTVPSQHFHQAQAFITSIEQIREVKQKQLVAYGPMASKWKDFSPEPVPLVYSQEFREWQSS